MATSPAVLASSSSSTATSPATPTGKPARPSVTPLILTLAAGLIVAALSVGGGLLYFVHSGRFTKSAGAIQKPWAAVPIKTHVVLLEPMVVNLADEGGGSYLRIAVALRVFDNPTAQSAAPQEDKGTDDKGATETVAPIRDTLLTVLTRETAEDLMGVKGPERLKAAMKAAIAEHNSYMRVQDIFFTDFLVQR